MLRYLFEMLFGLFIFGLIRSILSSIVRSSGSGSIPNPSYRGRPDTRNVSEPEMRPLGELRKDPVCGTFVAMNSPYTRIDEGVTSYFCSKECRDRYKSGRKTQDPWQKSTTARS